MGYAAKPSNYDYLKKLRTSKKASLKPCAFLKPTTKLRYYQVIGALHMMMLSRMLLGDSAGLGKTLQVIAAYAYTLVRQPDLKLLVVTPKSAADQWAEEFEKFTTGISVHVLKSEYGYDKVHDCFADYDELKAKKIKRRKIYEFEARKAQYDTVDAQVLIITYYPLKEEYEFILKNRGDKFMVAFDEAQEFKSEKTKAYFAASKIAEQASRVYGLSATPIKNRLEEIYNIYNVLVPGLFGSRTKFNKNFAIRKKMKVGWGRSARYFQKTVGYKNLDQFRDTLDPYFLNRRTRDVADELPRLISKKVMLDMTKPQEKLYKQALSGELYRRVVQDRLFQHQQYMNNTAEPSEKDYKLLASLEAKYDESMTKEGLQKSKLAALSFCQLVSNGPAWLNEEGDSSKELEFKRLFDQDLSEEKVIVFTRFKSGIKHLEAILDGLERPHVKITGDCSRDERNEARLAFQDDKKNVNTIFITFAGSAALNLQTANVILFYDTPWSYGDLYQTIGRAQRIGSIYEHIHLIHMINRKSIDEHVLEILEAKKGLINDVMGDIAEGAIEFKDDVLFHEEESDVDALFASVFGKAA